MATDYTIVNDQTGEERVISWEGKNPPTQEDIAHISLQLSKPQAAAPDANAPLHPALDRSTLYNAGEVNSNKIPIDAKDGAKNSLLSMPSRKTIADFIRPLLEGGGMIAGTVAGLPAAPETLGLSSVAGASLGYAGAKKLADFIEGRQPEVITGNAWIDPMLSSGKDVLKGAEMDMEGQIAGRFIGPAVSPIINFVKNKIPFTNSATTRKVAQEFNDAMTPASEDLARQYAANEAEAQALQQRIGSDTPLTPGQSSNNIQARLLEQSRASKDKVLAEMLAENDAKNLGSAASNLKQTIGIGADMPMPPSKSTIGANISSTLEDTLTPIQAAERELWAKVPEYPMPHDNFAATAKELTSTPMIKSAEDAVNGVISYAARMPKTAQGLQSIERTISSEINRLSAGAQPDREAARALILLKQSIAADFEAMGAAATSGDIAIHNGSIVIPSQLKSEIAALTERAKAAAASGANLKEKNIHLYKYLLENGEPNFGLMPGINTSDATYAETLNKRLAMRQSEGKMLDYKPPAGGANQQELENLQNGIAMRQDMLANLQPAEDVATAYNAAKQFSKSQKFDRFGTPAVSKTMQHGEQQTGLKMAPENISEQFFTPQGSKDLIKAVGPQQAKEQMAPHVTDLILSKATRPDGTLDIQRSMAIIRQNRDVLKNLDLVDHAHSIVKGQIPSAIRARLESQGVDILNNPKMGAREAAKFVRDYAPALRTLYGNSSKEMIAMQDYAKMIDILSRNKNVSASGGSTSIEKMMMDAPKESFAGKLWVNLGAVLAGSGVGYMAGGGMGGIYGGAAVKLGQTALVTARQHQQQIAEGLVREAITNPETAKFLMAIGKGQKVTPTEINRNISILTGYAVFRPQ